MRARASEVFRSLVSLTAISWLAHIVGYIAVNFIYPRRLVKVPKSTKLHPTVLLRQSKNIFLGEHCLLNHGCVLQAGYDTAVIKLGNFVHCGPYVQFFAYNHRFDDVMSPSIQQGYLESDIIVEDDVWIGAGTVVAAGSVIPRGCVIGANSVVTGRLEHDFGVYAGVPARFIKSRYQ